MVRVGAVVVECRGIVWHGICYGGRVGADIMSDNSLARYLYSKMCHNTLITHFVKNMR